MKKNVKKIPRFIFSNSFKIVTIYSLIAITLILLLVTGVSYYYFSQSKPKAEKTDVKEESLFQLFNNSGKINLSLDKGSFNPNKLELESRLLYEVSATKDNENICAYMTLREFNKNYDFTRKSTYFTLKINSSGNYRIECNDNVASIDIKVK